MPTNPQFPTPIHQQAAEEILHFARTLPVHAVLLVNSCARGTATAQSDLDIALLIDPELFASERRQLDRAWSERYQNVPIFRELEQLGRFSSVHLDFFDGQWTPEVWDDGGGPDAFEIEIGNRVAYSAPLWEGGNMFADLRARWLPYYGDELRKARLKMVIDACLLDFERIPFLVARGLIFMPSTGSITPFRNFSRHCSSRTAFIPLPITNGSANKSKTGWGYPLSTPNFHTCWRLIACNPRI